MTKNTLNLLVIDGDQLYAERLVDLLSLYYDDVKLGFLDDKKELEKHLRHQWDVLIYGKAYDMKLTDVIGIVQEKSVDLPVIGLMNNDGASASQNSAELPKVIDNTLIKAVNPEKESQIIISIILQHQAVKDRREMVSLRHIISEAEQRANILIKNSKSAVAYIDEGIHVFANEPYLKMFGYQSMDDLMGVPVIDLISGGDDIKEFKQFLRRFTKGSRDNVEFKFESKRTDGSTFKAKLQLATATYEGLQVTQFIIQQNKTANINTAEIAKKLAAAERQDSLTGLENRLGFIENLEKYFNAAKAGKIDAGLLYINLDSIGRINMSLGIDGVDTTVKHIANMLSEYFSGDYVSHFSDSVFTVLLKKTDEKDIQQHADTLIEKVEDTLIEVGNRTTSTTFSIGMVLMDEQSPSSDIILQRAMEAVNQVMIESNNDGNGSHLYDPSANINNDDSALAEYMAGAFDNDRFILMYQPIYDIDTDSSTLFEVYLRLGLSDGTTLSPPQFLHVAKSNDLLAKIDRWLMINTCKQLNQVREQHPTAGIIIRLTSDTLVDEQLPNIVGQLVKALGGDASALTLQFSEQDVINYLAVAKKQFALLASLNCRICLCDFGSSAKSVEIIEHVQPQMVRLAKNYVDNAGDPDGVVTLKALIAQANERNVQVLMPCIEEASIMSVAWSVGARYLQGNYLQGAEPEMNFG